MVPPFNVSAFAPMLIPSASDDRLLHQVFERHVGLPRNQLVLVSHHPSNVAGIVEDRLTCETSDLQRQLREPVTLTGPSSIDGQVDRFVELVGIVVVGEESKITSSTSTRVPVVPVPASDQGPVPSSLVARTWTSHSVLALSPEIVAVVALMSSVRDLRPTVLVLQAPPQVVVGDGRLGVGGCRPAHRQTGVSAGSLEGSRWATTGGWGWHRSRQ